MEEVSKKVSKEATADCKNDPVPQTVKMQLQRTVGLMKLKKCPYEQTCFLFMPVFLSSSSSTIDCRETDIKMACSLDIVIHCSLSFDMRYSNDSSS